MSTLFFTMDSTANAVTCIFKKAYYAYLKSKRSTQKSTPSRGNNKAFAFPALLIKLTIKYKELNYNFVKFTDVSKYILPLFLSKIHVLEYFKKAK